MTRFEVEVIVFAFFLFPVLPFHIGGLVETVEVEIRRSFGHKVAYFRSCDAFSQW